MKIFLILLFLTSAATAQGLDRVNGACPLLAGSVASQDNPDGSSPLLNVEVAVLLEKLDRHETLNPAQLQILVEKIQQAFDPYTHDLTFDVIGTATDIQMKLERRVPLELYEVQYLREGFAGKF